MAVPECMVHFIPPGQEDLHRFISTAANQSVRPYNTNEEYLYAMKEDLAEWLKNLYDVDLDVTNFLDELENGILLCEHANQVNVLANKFRDEHKGEAILKKIILPSKNLHYNKGHHASTFFARDNVANFINWCRRELLIAESVMFETNDLVLRKNEKNFILCLLEVARRGSKFGVPAPVLIQMEEDIDKEIEEDEASYDEVDNFYDEPEIPKEPPKQKVAQDFKSLDEMVQYILGMCTCPAQFPMVKVGEGKYKIGDSKTNIFMRILRNHVMVRVGGGWDTLEHYLDKHDPCRCNRHRVEQKIAARLQKLGLVLTHEEEKILVERAKRDARDFKARNRSLSTGGVGRVSLNKTFGGRTSQMEVDSPRTSVNSRRSKTADDRNHYRSSSSPGVVMHDKKCVDANNNSKSSKRSSTVVNLSRPSHTVANDTQHLRSRSPRPSKNINQNNNNMQQHTSSSTTKNNGTSLKDSNNNSRPSLSISKTSNLRKSTTNLSSTNFYGSNDTVRSKTPTDLRSSSSSSMARVENQRRSITPTPTVTSQKRAALSLQRSKSPDPDRFLSSTPRSPSTTRSSVSAWKSPRGPPTSYRNSETLPRNYKSSNDTTSRSKGQRTSESRPSHARSYTNLVDSERQRSSTPVSNLKTSKSRYSSMQDVRPKSSISSSNNLSKEQKARNRPSTAESGFKRLSTSDRSKSMDSVAYQKPLSISTTSRASVYDRLSQPKGQPKTRNRNKVEQKDLYVVERQSSGQHKLQKDEAIERDERLSPPSTPRKSQTNVTSNQQNRKSNTTSSINNPITPKDLRLRTKQNELSESLQLNLIQTSTPSSPGSNDSPTPSLKFNISLSSDSSSPTRVMYSWSQDGSTEQGHTPKIMDRRKTSPAKDSHLKAPPKRKVSTEEMLQVLRDPEGRHVWEHTESSIEKSNELIELSPYKEQIESKSPLQSPRNTSASYNWTAMKSNAGESTKSNANVRSPRQSTDYATRKLSSSSSEHSAVNTTPKRPSYMSQYRKVTSVQKSAPSQQSLSPRQSSATHQSSSPRQNAPPRQGIMKKTERPTSAVTSSNISSKSAGNLRNHKMTTSKTPTVLQKSNVSDQVRKMLYSSSTTNMQSPTRKQYSPRTSSTLPRNYAKQRQEKEVTKTPIRSTTPTPKSQYKSTLKISKNSTATGRMRSKTPDPKDFQNNSRLSTFKRQERLKEFDGPRRNYNRSSSVGSDEVLQDDEWSKMSKEERMLREMEQECLKNQEILKSTLPQEESFEEDASPNKVEYDYNGRRIRKKSRSKSPSPKKSSLRSRSERTFSYDSGSPNNTGMNTANQTPYAESMADSEDFEVAMAMGAGVRSKSMDNVLRPTSAGPKPRKEKLVSDKKSRIPTPVGFNSGRRSADLLSESNWVSDATQSNVTGLSTQELRMHELLQAKEEEDRQKHMEERRRQQNQAQEDAEQLMLQQRFVNDSNDEIFFQYGSYGTSHGKHKSSVNKRSSPVQNNIGNSPRNSSSQQMPVEQHHRNEQIDRHEEPVVPPRRRSSGYHRSKADLSPAALMKPPTNQHLTATNDRNDSGIEIIDPESPGSGSIKSSVADSSSVRSTISVFSSDRTQAYDPTIPKNQRTSPKKYSHTMPQQTYYAAFSKPNSNPRQSPINSPTRNSLGNSYNENFYSDNRRLRNSLNELRNIRITQEQNDAKSFDIQQSVYNHQPHYTTNAQPQYTGTYNDSNNNTYPLYNIHQDTPPEPPPRRKSSFRAVQRSKHPEFAHNYTNNNQQKIYRMPNGMEIIQSQDGSEAMYV